MRNWYSKFFYSIALLALAATLGCSDGSAPTAIAQPIEPPVVQPDPPPVAPSLNQQRGSRLTAVRTRGTVLCASRGDSPGFAFDANNNGVFVGFDIDLCRAIAAAVLGNADAFQILPIAVTERGPILQSGQADVLTRQTTWTTLRDADWGDYAPIMFYDGQGFLVKRSLSIVPIISVQQLAGVTVCVTEGTTTFDNLLDFSRENSLNMTPLPFLETTDATAAYIADMCGAFTSDRSNLASFLSTLADPSAHVVLPETISEEPLGPVTPHDDGLWSDIVKTVMSMLIYAEAYGITSTTVPTTLTGDVEVDRLFGLEGTYGQASLGLSQTAAQDVIRAVGNYSEIYERNLGSGGLGLSRENSRNALWAAATCTDCPKGGQLYAAPLR